MTTIDPEPTLDTPVGADLTSLAGQIAQARKARDQKRKQILTFTVPGTGGKLAASYRRLPYEQKVEIATRHGEQILENAGVQVAASADMLINSCTDLLEVVGRDEDGSPQYRSLGLTWNAASICELFQLEMRPGLTGRMALMEALDHEDLIDHFTEVSKGQLALDREDEDGLPGESVPSVEG